MFIAYFSLMSLTMMVFSAYVIDTVLHSICYYLIAACDWLWFIKLLSNQRLHLVVISVFQRYKTDLSISIGWYINIRSVKEITVFSYKFELKPYNLKCYYRIFTVELRQQQLLIFLPYILRICF